MKIRRIAFNSQGPSEKYYTLGGKNNTLENCNFLSTIRKGFTYAQKKVEGGRYIRNDAKDLFLFLKYIQFILNGSRHSQDACKIHSAAN